MISPPRHLHLIHHSSTKAFLVLNAQGIGLSEPCGKMTSEFLIEEEEEGEEADNARGLKWQRGLHNSIVRKLTSLASLASRIGQYATHLNKLQQCFNSEFE